MADQIENLRKLQSVDGELFRLRREEQRLPQELEQAKQAVDEQTAKAKSVEARLKAIQLQHKEKEIDLSSREANVKKLQGQLFQVKTNKEYAAIQHEIEQAKADTSLLEEEIITLLDGIDQTSKEHAEELAKVAQREQQLRKEQDRVTQALEVIRAQMAKCEARRKEMLPLVEPNTLSIYERILASREGVAIVPLIDDSCTGCHMVQPPQVVNEAHLQARLVMCQNCNRILYIDEEHRVSSSSAGP
jgi:predicted  nucleic acid-binding Zn-ribbon protein